MYYALVLQMTVVSDTSGSLSIYYVITSGISAGALLLVAASLLPPPLLDDLAPPRASPTSACF
jgi:hypothetical protein